MKPLFTSRKRGRWLVHFITVIAGATLAATAQPSQPSPGDFKPLFNGTNLDGWVTRGGKASYEVQDGVIVGTATMKGGGNTFLCTEKEYGDFILELEIKADREMNSGVQIRSHCFDAETTYDFGHQTVKIPAKRVHGYQVEVDNRPERRWSGGIYEEARRNWLFPLATNSAAGQAFKFGDWNKYRIQCIGSSIKTWINDVPAADLIDAELLRGFIGLQVHGTDKGGLQVRFRNVRLQDLGAQQWAVAWDCNSMDGLEESGPAQWQLKANTVHATQAKEAATAGALKGTSPLMDFTVRLKYKIVKGSFNLTFQPQSGSRDSGGFSFPFVERMDTTNFAHVQDWNTVVASVQPTRVVVLLNGHQVKDATVPRASGVLPGLELPAGWEAEVQFKEFEILSPQ
jgi:hypothetical protein